MTTQLLDHPLSGAWLAELRHHSTAPPRFRHLVTRLSAALAWEATRHEPTVATSVPTPLGVDAPGLALADPRPVLVPVLRAGVWMLEGVLELLEEAEVGMVGMARDEATLAPLTYVERLPEDLSGRRVLVLDPMLATGGSLCAVGSLLASRGCARASVLCVLAAPEGVARLGAELPTWDLHLGGLDERLDQRGFILPGLGDAGDRLCG